MPFELSGPLLILGAGKMGGALVAGLLARGLDPKHLLILDPAPPPETEDLIRSHNLAAATASFDGVEGQPSVILAAVKPQVMDDVFPPVARLAGSDTLTLSIAAGRTIASFEQHLPGGSAVVRAMPNTPASIGHGMTVCCANAATRPDQRELATALMSAVGEVAWVEDEGLMNAVTAVSGSGPAYVFHLAECMAAAGVAAGLDAELAAKLARTTVAGAGALLAESELSAEQLRCNVTSPGGTTAAAIDVLMAEEAMKRLVDRAIAAAHARGHELSGT